MVDLDRIRRVRHPQPIEPDKPTLSNRRRRTARALVAFGCFAGTGLGLSAFLIDLTIVYEIFGAEALTLSTVLAPLTFLAMPWYALLQQSDPGPVLLGYAGPLAGWLMVGFGRSLTYADDHRRPRFPESRRRGDLIAFRPRRTKRPRSNRRIRPRPGRTPALAPARNS